MGTIAEKLSYLGATKSKFYQAMEDLGYPVTSTMTLREVVNLLVEEAIKKDIDLDVSSLPEYWQDDVTDALAYTMSLGDGYVHHLVTTDNHYVSNYRKSALIQSVLYDTGLYSKVINVGDITNGGSDSEIEAVTTDYQEFGNDFLLALGNHDLYTASPSKFYPLIANNTDIVGEDKNNFNYYVDDSVNHIRYIVIDTPYNSGNARTLAYQYLVNAPSGYHSIIITHYPFVPYSYYADGGEVQAEASAGAGWLLLHTLGLTNKFLIGVLVGHQHIDHFDDYLNLGFEKQLALLNDGYYYDYSDYAKIAGTNGENAVSILSINTTEKDVKLYRIGRTSLLPRRFSFRYGNKIADNTFVKGILHLVNDGISTSDNQSYTCLRLLPAYDSNDNVINYYIINRASGTIIDHLYESIYVNGNFDGRRVYSITQRNFSKYPILYVSHGNGLGTTTDFLLGFTVSDNEYAQNAEGEDFILTSTPEDYELGYELDEIEWVEGIWRNENSINTYAGYIGTKFINVKPGKSYTIHIDDNSWSCQYLIVVGLNGGGRSTGNILYISRRTTGDITFTIPANTKYIQICSDNLANYTNKFSLVKN